MKIGKLLLLPTLMSTVSAAQVVEVVLPCMPIPEEVINYRRGLCFIQMKEEHLAIEIQNQDKHVSIMQSVTEAMNSFGFSSVSENLYWYPDNRSCYYSWFGSESSLLVFVRSGPGLSFQRNYCGLEEKRYDSNLFALEIEEKLRQEGLLDSVSMHFTNIEVDTLIYEEILQSGGSPGLMTLPERELMTIDMQY